MKSPWRFLTDLTSRRKPDKTPLELSAAARETIVTEDKCELANASSATVSASLGTATSEETAKALATTVEHSLPAAIELKKETGEIKSTSLLVTPSDAERSTAPGDEAKTPLTTEIEPERPADAVRLETGMKSEKRVKLVKKRSTVPTTMPAVDKPRVDLPAAQPLDFFGQAFALDAEIAELKLALTQKLKQQNAQLKKTLARFDVG